jgi:hypothetical protein
MLKWLTNIQKGAEYDMEKYYGAVVIGEPKATEHYTADQLADMGLIGVYRHEPAPAPDGVSGTAMSETG